MFYGTDMGSGKGTSVGAVGALTRSRLVSIKWCSVEMRLGILHMERLNIFFIFLMPSSLALHPLFFLIYWKHPSSTRSSLACSPMNFWAESKMRFHIVSVDPSVHCGRHCTHTTPRDPALHVEFWVPCKSQEIYLWMKRKEDMKYPLRGH